MSTKIMGMMNFKDIPILIMKLVRFSTKTMCKCLHKYPLLSGTLLVFFLLHLFFPFAFVLLVCSVPFFLAAFIVYTRFLSTSPAPKLPDSNRNLPSIKCESKNTPKKKPYISAQMSRRRNFRAKIDDPVPHEHNKPMTDVSSPMKHFLSPDESGDQDDQNLIWRNEKMVEESLNELKNKESETTTPKNNNPSNSQIDHLLVEDDDDEVEEVKASGNRVVAWNEDDQKNLMDLGLSEIERNQRLENLIAKRRARKFLMAIRGPAILLSQKEIENVLKMAPVKIDNLPSSAAASSSDDPIPGSAPSVLLPARNPFDIPYDPTEEKPNLTVDGFQQEFLGPAAHQISRHESFTHGPSFGIVKRESKFGRLRRPAVKGDHDIFIEKILYQQQDDPDEDESCSSANKEEQEAESAQQKDSQEASSLDVVEDQRQEQEISSSDQLLESLSTNPMKNNGCPNSNTMYGSRDSYIDYLNHTVAHHLTHSIASDMLVEVSEPGSPSCNIITPVDLQSSPSDGEEMEKETINFESQEEPPPPPPPLNHTMGQDVIEIRPSSSSVGEDKSSISVGNIELVENGEYSYSTDNKTSLFASSSSSASISMAPEEDEEEGGTGGGLLAPQSHSNEEYNDDIGRERRQRSCESLDQVVEIPEQEEEAIIFVDNSHSMPPLSPEQAAGDSRPTLQDNPEEIENQQPPAEDLTDTRNIQDDEFRNQTGHDIIPNTRKFDDEEYVNPFADSVGEEVDVIKTNNLIGSTASSHATGDEKLGREETRGDYEDQIQQLNSEPSVEDIKEESPLEQLKSEPLDILQSRGGESQPSSEESQAEARAPPIEQFMSEQIEGSQAGVSHAPTDEQVITKPVKGSRGEESAQAPLEEEAKSEVVEESQGESQAKTALV